MAIYYGFLSDFRLLFNRIVVRFSSIAGIGVIGSDVVASIGPSYFSGYSFAHQSFS